MYNRKSDWEAARVGFSQRLVIRTLTLKEGHVVRSTKTSINWRWRSITELLQNAHKSGISALKAAQQLDGTLDSHNLDTGCEGGHS
jgi:hypothetical protein